MNLDAVRLKAINNGFQLENGKIITFKDIAYFAIRNAYVIAEGMLTSEELTALCLQEKDASRITLEKETEENGN